MTAVLLGITILMLILLTWLSLKSKLFYHRLTGFKDNGHWFFGNMVEIRNSTIKHIVEKFPNFYRFSKGFARYRISCYHPYLISKVMKNSVRYPVDLHFVDTLFERNTLQESTGQQWKLNRNLIHFCYGIQNKNHQTNICREVFLSVLNKWQITDGNSIALNMNDLVTEIIYECSNRMWFGNDINSSERSHIKMLNSIYEMFSKTKEEDRELEKNRTSVMKYLIYRMKLSIMLRVLKHRFRSIHNCILKMRQRRILLERKRANDGILDRLIIAEMNGKFKLNDKHYTALFKSHHTFLDALRRAFRGLLIHLTENPEWQEKVREEIYYLEDKEMKTLEGITSRNAKCLPLFILESLRNQASGLQLKPRTLTDPIEFDGHYFPNGTLIEINLEILHRHPMLWQNESTFLPERFSENEKVELYKYLPFSTGERICPGKNLTVAVLESYLVTFLQQVKFQRNPPSESNNYLQNVVNIIKLKL